MRVRYISDWWGLGIIFIATLLRVYRLETLTEFLGDQGRTMLIMRDFVTHGIVPIAGPTTLTGHHLGPIFYYLLLPGYLLSGEPVGVSLWVALLGVVAVFLIYKTVHQMFGLGSARVIALLWAVSPALVRADRIIWEPNLVPLFSALFVFLLYKAYTLWRHSIWFSVGVSVGILVQLHYPNIFFVGLVGLVFLGSFIIKKRLFWEILTAGLWLIAGLGLTLVPFLWHQYTVGFKDLIGVATVIKEGVGVTLGKRATISVSLDYAFRVLGRAVPWMSREPAALLLGLWSLFVCFRPTLKNIFFSVWFFGGIAAMLRYSGVVHDHYLFFIVPVPFLMIASIVQSTKPGVWRGTLYGIVIMVSFLQLLRTDIFSVAQSDIPRVRNAVAQIKDVVNENDFSFTLVNTVSYSDLHYRYYMEAMDLQPMPAVAGGYKRFIVACDRADCPTVGELTQREQLPILCYEEHCKQYYPSIPLSSQWAYSKDIPVANNLGRLYIFDAR